MLEAGLGHFECNNSPAQDLVNSEIKAAQKIEKTYMKLTEKTMLEGRLTILEGQIRGLLARG